MQLCRFTAFFALVAFGAISATQLAAGYAGRWIQKVGLWSQKLGDAMIEKPTMELRNVTAMPKVCDVLLHVLDLLLSDALLFSFPCVLYVSLIFFNFPSCSFILCCVLAFSLIVL